MKFVRDHPILVVTAIILIALAYYWIVFSVYSHRYRLTIEVETPDGLKTGSAVIEPRARTQSPGLSLRSVVTRVRGDAVFVDLGNGKNVVGLMAGGPEGRDVGVPVRLAMEAFGVRNCRKSMCDWRQMQSMSGRRDLPLGLVPTLVTFGDVDDPKTARVIEPSEFEAIFGPGYRFKRAWIEITDDWVTRGIKQRLPWLEGFTGLTGGSSRMTPGKPGKNLGADQFTQG
jgi:hypothetical protein